MSRQAGWTGTPHLDAIAGLDVVVSDQLPIPPSPGELARRIVRHGFNDAGLLPRAAGPVGPRPGDKTRALQIGRQLLVDRDLATEIRDAQDAHRRKRESEASRRRQHTADMHTLATVLGVRHVSTVHEPDYRRTTYRAHLEAEGAIANTVDVVFEDRELHRQASTSELLAHVANRLRTALAWRKLDEEDAARAGGS